MSHSTDVVSDIENTLKSCFVLVINHMMETPLTIYKNSLQKVKRSSIFAEETCDYAADLVASGLPVIFTPRHLAIHLGEEYSVVAEFRSNRSTKYHYFVISKKNGGKRRIIAPSHHLLSWQTWIKTNILDHVSQLDCVTGFVKNRSIVDNAMPHKDKKFILKMDIKDFFESISEYDVRRVFRSLGYTSQVAYELATICTTNLPQETIDYSVPEALQPFFEPLETSCAFLVQGAPTSPIIANLCCRNMDENILRYAKQKGFNYTRYADDLTFSSDTKESLPSINVITRILAKYHFKVNNTKTQLLTHTGSQYVTGLLVDGRIRVPGRYKRDIYRHLHFCEKNGGRTHAMFIAPGKSFYREWLMGRIYFVNEVEPEEAKKMLAIASRVDWFK